MENLTIVLNLEGKEKKFVTTDFIKGSMFRKAADVASIYETDAVYDSDDLDGMISFVCELFNHQFTMDEFEDGTDSRNLMKTIYGVANYVMGNIAEASALLSGEIEKDAEGKSN